MSLNIAIIGIGLIGGSLGLAIKNETRDDTMITGVDSTHSSLIAALELGAVDRVTTNASVGVSDADIIFFCTPVLQIPQLIKDIGPAFKQGAIISDVGSTKQYLRENIEPILPPGVHYVPGHPMAGREKSGIIAADKNLFKDKWYILTPSETTPQEAVDKVRNVLKLTGARLTFMDVEAHDHCAAIISHIPHVAAAALVNLLDCYPGKEESTLELAGGGFCDTTRIASSNADMWADICMTNEQAIIEGLEHLQEQLEKVKKAIQADERAAIHEFFRLAKARRDSIIASL
jgi:prephenate dehydrogenase